MTAERIATCIEEDQKKLLRAPAIGGWSLQAVLAALPVIARTRWARSPLRGESMSYLLFEAISDMEGQRAPLRSLIKLGAMLDLFVTTTAGIRRTAVHSVRCHREGSNLDAQRPRTSGTFWAARRSGRKLDRLAGDDGFVVTDLYSSDSCKPKLTRVVSTRSALGDPRRW